MTCIVCIVRYAKHFRQKICSLHTHFGKGEFRKQRKLHQEVFVALVEEVIEERDEYWDLMRTRRIRNSSTLLLLELKRLADGRRVVWRPDREAISKSVPISHVTYGKCIDELRSRGFIRRVRKGKIKGYQLFPLTWDNGEWVDIGGGQ